MGEWTSKTWPDGCRNCGTTVKTCIGRGLCSTCYQNDEIKARYGPSTVRGVRDVATSKIVDEAQLSVVPPDGHADADDYRPLGEDSASDPLLSEGPSPYTPGERAPGGGPSSADAPGRPGKKGLRGLFAKREPKAPGQEAPTTKEKRPKAQRSTGRRVTTADTVADVWAGVGGLAVRSGRHVPLGRYMQFSSGVSGEMLDDVVKGTVVDKMVLQPIVKGRSRFDALGAIFGPPALILAIERDPSKAAVLMPILKSSIRNALPLMAPAIKRVQKREEEMAKAAAELFPDLPPGEDPVDAILAMMFEGWTPPEPEPQESTEPQDESMVA